jgi:hypothetical protein
MNVRQAAKTTLSLLFFALLFAGLAAIWPRLIGLLPEAAAYTLTARFSPPFAFAGYYAFILGLALRMIVAAGVLDAILRHRTGLNLLSSFSTLISGLPVVVLAFIPAINAYVCWGVAQMAAAVGVYWTFRKLTRNNRLGGQKLLPFIKEMKTGGGPRRGHVADHYIVFAASLLLIALYVLLLASLLFFVITNGSMFI